MRIDVQTSADEVARAGAKFIAAEAEVGVTVRGRFVLGACGGHVSWRMFRALADESMPWNSVHPVQVYERVAGGNDPMAASAAVGYICLVQSKEIT